MMVKTNLEVKLGTLRETVDFLDKWQTLSKKKSLENSFFNMLVQEKRTAAKKVLEKMKEKSRPSLWHQGYINALEGMVAASEMRHNRNIFLNHIRVERCNELRKTFLNQSKNSLLEEFDRGFFAAWADYMQVFKRTVNLR